MQIAVFGLLLFGNGAGGKPEFSHELADEAFKRMVSGALLDSERPQQSKKMVRAKCHAAVDLIVNFPNESSFTDVELETISDLIGKLSDDVEIVYPESNFGFGIFDDSCKDFGVFTNPQSQIHPTLKKTVDSKHSDLWRGTKIKKGLRKDTPIAQVMLNILKEEKPEDICIEEMQSPMFPVFLLRSFDYSNSENFRDVVDQKLSGKGSVHNLELYDYTLMANAFNNAMGAWCDQNSPVEEIQENTCEQEDHLVVLDVSASTAVHETQILAFAEETFGKNSTEYELRLVSFSDKPIKPFGFEASKDYCYKQHESNLQGYQTLLHELLLSEEHERRSGGDVPENQLDAIIRGVRSTKFKQTRRCNCVSVVTDGPYHQRGDFSEGSIYLPEAPDCKKHDYPSIAQVAQELIHKDVHCVSIATIHKFQETWTSFGQELRNNLWDGKFSVTLLPVPHNQQTITEKKQQEIVI